MRILLYLPLACLLLCSSAFSATFTVTSTSDSGPGSFRQALTDANAAAGADTIEFAIPNANPGGSAINLSTALPDISDDLTINGTGMDVLTINRNSTNQFDRYRIFSIAAGANVVISGLTIQNGLAPVVVGEAWTSSSGGGISNVGNLTINDCRISGNRVLSDVSAGGGISNIGQLTVNRTIFSGNDAASRWIGTAQQSQRGSAVYNQGTATLSDVTITGSGHGGAVFEYLFGTMTITRANIFANNTVGIVNQTGTLTVYDSSIYQNVVSNIEPSLISAGGFVSLSQNGNSGGTNLINTTISENVGYTGGGIYAIFGPPLNIVNCTIVGNRSLTTTAGGIYSSTLATMQNSIVAGNINSSGPSDLGFFSPNPAYPPSSFNLIGIGSGTAIQNGVNGNIVGTAAAPVDPQVSALNYFGGNMPVNMPLPTSPVINAGSSVLASDHDERGVQRPVGPRQDIGAVEFNLTPHQFLPHGALELPYDQPFQAFGLPVYSHFQFSISAGSLPPGLTLQDTGSNTAKIAGTPTSKGTFSFTVLAVDPLGYAVSADYSITIHAAGSISWFPVTGRMITPDNAVVRNAIVQAIDLEGNVVAEGRTNPFGYFHFASVRTYEIYSIRIRHKSLTASPLPTRFFPDSGITIFVTN